MRAYWHKETATIYHSDCLKVLAKIPENSVDTVITDLPYHLTQVSRREKGPAGRHRLGKKGFMGQTWDGGGIAFNLATWQAVLRVMKPGGFLLAMGGTRTWHRLACAIEDAGFEIRDSLLMLWTYGQGFAKSKNVSAAIDKKTDYRLQSEFRRAYVQEVENAGLVLPENSKWDWTLGEHAPGNRWWKTFCEWLPDLSTKERKKIERRVIAKGFRIRKTSTVMITCESHGEYDIIAPASPDAADWHGWGTALKPAWEPILVAMKPRDGTFAENALKHGVGGLNVDGARIGTEDIQARVEEVARAVATEYQRGRDGEPSANRRYAEKGATHFAATPGPRGGSARGRWPANLMLSHDERCVLLGTRTVNAGKKASGHDWDVSVNDNPTHVAHNIKSGAYYGEETTELWACVPGCSIRLMDDASGNRKTTWISKKHRNVRTGEFLGTLGHPGQQGFNDSGGASRFFYHAKVSTRERNLGLDNIEEITVEFGKKCQDGRIKWGNEDHIVQLLVDTALSRPKVIGGSTLHPKGATAWSTFLFGKSTSKKSHQATASIIAMAIPLTIESRTFKWFQCLSTSESTQDASRKTENGKSHVESVGCSTPWVIITNKKTVSIPGVGRVASRTLWRISGGAVLRNRHCTLKPVDLMRYLCVLTSTPTGGIVLDPFMGAGSTGIAAVLTGRPFIGIEKDKESCRTSRCRIKHAQKHPEDFADKQERKRAEKARKAKKPAADGLVQSTLFEQ